MQYTTLGQSGLQVSRICLGGNSWGAAGRREWGAFDAAASRSFFARALELGINFFDTANSYNAGASEEIIGTELHALAARDDLVITTKAGWPLGSGPNRKGLSRKHLMTSLDASLRRLKTDYVDVFMLHQGDALTPVEETMSALGDIVRSGKARYVAASNMRPTQFARLQLFARYNGLPKFVAMQNLYNLIDRGDEADLIPFCREEGVGLTPYSPLARGTLGRARLAGSAQTARSASDAMAARYAAPEGTAIAARVAEVAGELGVSPGKVALSWLLHQPGLVGPVVGVTRLEQLDEAVAACDVKLDGALLDRLSAQA